MSKIKICALGGLNELGKNMYIVEVNDDIYVFDAGLKYADDRMLGVDYIIPNYEYLINNQDRIQGIFITHGHDEQMGAIADMIIDLPKVNIYGTKFTLDIIKIDLQGIPYKNKLVEINPHKKLNVGSCSIFPINLSHNVPETVGYVLYTDDGAIFYTGNFVFDPTMLSFYNTDIGKLAYVGKQGVLCLMSESILANRTGYTTPHHRTYNYLRELINRCDKRILVNIYQGQIYRLQELFNAVMETDRQVVIMGKTLQEIIIRAIDNKYIDFDKSRIGSIHHIKDPRVVVIISDEREKPFSNLKRIVKGYDKFITLKTDDTVVVASPVYDGLEKTASDLFNEIAKKDVNLVTLSGDQYPSPHASSEDLLLMLDLMNPKYYFPVIGEYRNQVANADVAKTVGFADENIILALNGQVITFENGELVSMNEIIKTDEILIDGKTAGDIGEIVIKDREMLGENGIVIVMATVEKESKKILSGPEFISKGFVFLKENKDLIAEAEKMALDIIKDNTKPFYIDYVKVKNEIRDKIGKYLYQETDSKPMILSMIQEIEKV